MNSVNGQHPNGYPPRPGRPPMGQNGSRDDRRNGYGRGTNPARRPTGANGQNRRPPESPDADLTPLETFLEKWNGWRLGISIEIEPIIRGLVCLMLISVFALLQTTLFARFRLFGAVPDLMLPLVVAISMIAREKWGAASGIAAAFIIESLGGASVTILALLYMPVGYICGLLTVYCFRDGPAVRALYIGAASMAKGLFTLLILVVSKPSVSLPGAFLYAVIPEFFVTVLFAFLPFLAVKYVFRLTEGKGREE